MSLSKKIATLFALCAALTMDTVRGDPIICYESGHECTSFDQCCSQSCDSGTGTCLSTAQALTMDTVRGDPIICYEPGHDCTSGDQCCSQSCDSGTGTCLGTAQLPAFDLDTADKEIVEPFVDLEPQMVQE